MGEELILEIVAFVGLTIALWFVFANLFVSKFMDDPELFPDEPRYKIFDLPIFIRVSILCAALTFSMLAFMLAPILMRW